MIYMYIYISRYFQRKAALHDICWPILSCLEALPLAMKHALLQNPTLTKNSLNEFPSHKKNRWKLNVAMDHGPFPED